SSYSTLIVEQKGWHFSVNTVENCALLWFSSTPEPTRCHSTLRARFPLSCGRSHSPSHNPLSDKALYRTVISCSNAPAGPDRVVVVCNQKLVARDPRGPSGQTLLLGGCVA